MAVDSKRALECRERELECAVAAARGVPAGGSLSVPRYCGECGGEIPERRRQVAPLPRLCVPCKSLEEQREVAFAARLVV